MSSSSSDTLFQLRQSAILLLTAMIWGATFVAQSLGMDSVGPFTFTTTRMLLGAFFLLPIVLLRRKRLAAEKPAEAARRSAPQYRRTLLMGGILCGLCLFGGESLQQFGFVHDTEVGKSGFITALYIVFVPIISLFLGRRGSPLLWAAVALSLVGLWFLCIPPEGFTIAAGDLFVLACAVVFSLHILVIGRYVLLVDAVELSMMQFFCGSILAFFAMLALESPHLDRLADCTSRHALGRHHEQRHRLYAADRWPARHERHHVEPDSESGKCFLSHFRLAHPQ